MAKFTHLSTTEVLTSADTSDNMLNGKTMSECKEGMEGARKGHREQGRHRGGKEGKEWVTKAWKG